MPNDKFGYDASAFSIITNRPTKYAERGRHPNKVVRVPSAQLTLHNLNPPLPTTLHDGGLKFSKMTVMGGWEIFTRHGGSQKPVA